MTTEPAFATPVDASRSVAEPLLWRFAAVELDERSMELRLHGKSVHIERAPLRVLQLLLRHAGEIVSYETLLNGVWKRSRETISRNAVSNAIAKLRRAIGDEQQTIIAASPQSGYRITVPVESHEAPQFDRLDELLRPSDPVPHAPRWTLERELLTSRHAAVWTAIERGTGVRNVFKFATQQAELAALRREAKIARMLHEALGIRPEFVVQHETQFEQAPYFIRSDYGGESLPVWVAERGGWGDIGLDERLDMLARLAEALALAHGIGLLHKDLKPGNLLISTQPNGQMQVRVIDFGSGQLLDSDILHRHDISALIGSSTESDRNSLMYMAPELLVGRAPTLASDVYAFGVLLYQFVVGDLSRPIAPSWEADVEDPLLREDIARSTQGDPALRSHSLQEFAGRLRALPQRREALREQLERERRMRQVEEALRMSHARRPWVLAAICIFAIGFSVSAYFGWVSVRERDHAEAQYQLARSINDFLTQGFLQAANPARGGDPGISVVDAMRSAAKRLDGDLASSRDTLAALHQVLGNDFLALQDNDEALKHFRRAVELLATLPAGHDDERLNVDCDLAGTMFMNGDSKGAQALAAQIETRLGDEAGNSLATRSKCHQLLGMLASFDANQPRAVAEMKIVAELVAGNKDATEQQRGLSRVNYGMALVSAGRATEGLALIEQVADEFAQRFGDDQFETLSARGVLADALLQQGERPQAIALLQQCLAGYSARMGPNSVPARHIRMKLQQLQAGPGPQHGPGAEALAPS